MNKLFLKRSWVEVDLEQISVNYETYLSEQHGNTKIIAVVKADAYGHGAVPIAKKLASLGVDFFAVSNLNEAIELRENGICGEILILGYTSGEFASVINKYNLIQTLVSEEHADEMLNSGSKLRCQFAIDTGMNRIGLNANDLEYCERTVRKYADVFELSGIFTHLCIADQLDYCSVKFTDGQIEKFVDLAQRLQDLHMPYIHSMNSAGGYYREDAPDAKNYIRLGIMLYGLKPDSKNELPQKMRGALSWKSVVSMVKNVKSGESIGYGRSYIASSDIKVATIPTGYADGYPRALSNKGYVLLNGKRANIVGKVCMDQMMIDVTDISDVSVGDTVVLIGEDNGETLSADELAAMSGTIGYEIVCGISKRVNRIYKGE